MLEAVHGKESISVVVQVFIDRQPLRFSRRDQRGLAFVVQQQSARVMRAAQPAGEIVYVAPRSEISAPSRFFSCKIATSCFCRPQHPSAVSFIVFPDRDWPNHRDTSRGY